ILGCTSRGRSSRRTLLRRVALPGTCHRWGSRVIVRTGREERYGTAVRHAGDGDRIVRRAGQRRRGKRRGARGAWVQTAFNKGDVATLQTLMTEDHVTVLTYAQFSNAPSQLKVLSDFKFATYRIDDLVVKPLSDDAALVTYRATIKGTYKGRVVPSP